MRLLAHGWHSVADPYQAVEISSGIYSKGLMICNEGLAPARTQLVGPRAAAPSLD
ncbi:hypothetical protein BGZ94_004371, partial [Podila epigama]